MACLFLPAPARAHFILIAPESWMTQDPLGLPEKLGPCGNEGGGTPTGIVTPFRPGQTISVTIDEVVTHPGHYRVALAVNDRSELPPEPVVTPATDDPCGSVAVENPPALPVLADDVLPHTDTFGAPQTFSVTLPANVTCSKCTLQVLEFMSDHSAPCFYHHCADISIQGDVDTPTPTPTATPAPSSTPTPAPAARPCVGDCDHNGAVSVDELLTCIRIALGDLPLDSCPAIDPGGQGTASVEALVTAVGNALNGCPAGP